MTDNASSPPSSLQRQMPGLIPNRRILDKRFVAQLADEQVKEFAISAGARFGDNAMGRLLSVDVRTQSNNILHLVIKSVLPMSGIIDIKTLEDARNLVEGNPFPQEICYYKVIRPIFQEVCENMGDFTHFVIPKYFSSYTDTHGLNDYISLEDLRPNGYKTANKFKGLGFEEVMAVLKELSFFHAISYSLLERKHDKLRAVTEDPNCNLNSFNWNSSDRADAKLFFNDIISKSVEILRENGRLVGTTADKMERFAKDGHTIIMTLWRNTKKEGTKYFQTLIHGDLWTNNILFKYATDDKTVQDVKFIDFQRFRLGNVYEDLLYFIFTSTTAEFRKNHLQTCLGIYFQQFEITLQQQGHDLPTDFTEADLVKTFYDNLEYGFSFNLFTIPYQLGLQPPPPSPMTPIEGDFSNVFFTSQCNTSEPEACNLSNSCEAMKAAADSMKVAVRNSPIAQKRLKELAEEMIEHNVL